MNLLLGFFSDFWREPVRQRLYQLAPLAILLLAGVLRFHQINTQSLWYDEGNSFGLVERSVPDLIHAARLDVHPPGYYLALKAWTTFLGESEFGLRSLSAFLGILTVACVYALGKALFAEGAGTAAALLVAVNTFSVYYGQEARMYSAMALLGAASMLFYVRWLEHPTWPKGIAFALLNAAGIYTQYAYPAVMVVQGILFVFLLLAQQKNWRALLIQYVAVNLITLILFAPQVSTALVQITSWPHTGRPIPIDQGLVIIFQWFTYGKTVQNVPLWTYPWPILFLLASLIPDWKRHVNLASWWRRLLPWTWLLITIVPLFALNLFREANLKFLLPSQIAFALLLGRGIWLLWSIGSPMMMIFIEALPRLLAGLGLLSILTFTATTLDNLYNDPTFARSNYRAMAQTISQQAHSDDAIILDAPNQQEVFGYYFHTNIPIFTLPRGLGGDDQAAINETQSVIDSHHRIYVLFYGEVERDPNHVVEKTLNDHSYQVSTAWYGDVRLVQYAKLPTTSSGKLTINSQFGSAISLKTAELTSQEVARGDVLGITLTWTTTQKIDKRYKVTVQLLDAQGQVLAQHDAEPNNYLTPTTTWTLDQTVTDPHALVIPSTLAPGDYQLIVGMYDSDPPQQRLQTGGKDYSLLTSVRVK